MATSSIFSSVNLDNSISIEMFIRAAEASMSANHQIKCSINVSEINDSEEIRLLLKG